MNNYYFPIDVDFGWDLDFAVQHSTLEDFGVDGSRQAKALYPAGGYRTGAFSTGWCDPDQRRRVKEFLNARRGKLGIFNLYDPASRLVGAQYPVTLDGSTDSILYPVLGVDPWSGGNIPADLKIYDNGSEVPEGPSGFVRVSTNKAQIIGTIRGPYNIGASNNKFNITFNDSGVHNLTLTNGASRTATQIAAEITGYLGASGHAEVFNGALRVYGGTAGFGGPGTLKFNAVANSAALTLGMDYETHSPGGELIVQLINPVAAHVITLSGSIRERLLVFSMLDDPHERPVPGVAVPRWTFALSVREAVSGGADPVV